MRMARGTPRESRGAFAMVHSGLGNREQALDWLERAVDEGLVGYYLPSVELMWEDLRGDTRFRRVLSRLRLPERAQRK